MCTSAACLKPTDETSDCGARGERRRRASCEELGEEVYEQRTLGLPRVIRRAENQGADVDPGHRLKCWRRGRDGLVSAAAQDR